MELGSGVGLVAEKEAEEEFEAEELARESDGECRGVRGDAVGGEWGRGRNCGEWGVGSEWALSGFRVLSEFRVLLEFRVLAEFRHDRRD